MPGRLRCLVPLVPKLILAKTNSRVDKQKKKRKEKKNDKIYVNYPYIYILSENLLLAV